MSEAAGCDDRSAADVRARKGRSCAWPAAGPQPPEASGNTPDSGNVPGIASVELRGHGLRGFTGTLPSRQRWLVRPGRRQWR